MVDIFKTAEHLIVTAKIEGARELSDIIIDMFNDNKKTIGIDDIATAFKEFLLKGRKQSRGWGMMSSMSNSLT